MSQKLMNVAKMIDHTLLKADAKEEEIIKLCNEAKQYGFKSVCINPYWVQTAAQLLLDSGVQVCTVIGFPLGANTTQSKVYEACDAIKNGATEIDLVINIGALKSKQFALVENDIKDIVTNARVLNDAVIVKVILETCLLSEEEKKIACELSVKAGADFVKTSTGFSTGGATIEDIQLMRKIVGPDLGVKASGGVRSFVDVEKMVLAGANRIGASSGVSIVTNSSDTKSGY